MVYKGVLDLKLCWTFLIFLEQQNPLFISKRKKKDSQNPNINNRFSNPIIFHPCPSFDISLLAFMFHNCYFYDKLCGGGGGRVPFSHLSEWLRLDFAQFTQKKCFYVRSAYDSTACTEPLITNKTNPSAFIFLFQDKDCPSFWPKGLGLQIMNLNYTTS